MKRVKNNIYFLYIKNNKNRKILRGERKERQGREEGRPVKVVNFVFSVERLLGLFVLCFCYLYVLVFLILYILGFIIFGSHTVLHHSNS